MNRSLLLFSCVIFLLLVMVHSSKKDSTAAPLHYYEVGFNGNLLTLVSYPREAGSCGNLGELPKKNLLMALSSH